MGVSQRVAEGADRRLREEWPSTLYRSSFRAASPTPPEGVPFCATSPTYWWPSTSRPARSSGAPRRRCVHCSCARTKSITWANFGAGLPPAPVGAIAVHPRRTRYIYLGTEIGLFASEDSGATWSPTNEGPTNCAVEDLFWMGETLICATHGRGMFQIDLQ
jgi:hypothetical protein